MIGRGVDTLIFYLVVEYCVDSQACMYHSRGAFGVLVTYILLYMT